MPLRKLCTRRDTRSLGVCRFNLGGADDDLALGVLFECRRRHISVPEQMLISGFNDLEFMASSVPTLSSVRTNRYDMGRNAAAMVIEAIEGRRSEQKVVDLGFTVMVRQSSVRPSQGGRVGVERQSAAE